MRGRIRSIKPEVCSDEELWDAELASGLPLYRVFTGLWMYADREGRFEWRTRALKAAILPYWDGDMADPLDALERAEFIQRYEVDGESYGCVCKFLEHQTPNHKEPPSKLPPPPPKTTRPGPSQESPGNPGKAQYQSQERTEPVPGKPATSGNGTDLGNGTERISHAREAEPAGEDTLSLVRREFTERFLVKRAAPPGWPATKVAALHSLVGWVDQVGGDIPALVSRLMDGFFRDAWAAEQGFPIGALAGDPPKYLNPPSRGPGGAVNGTRGGDSSDTPKPKVQNVW